MSLVSLLPSICGPRIYDDLIISDMLAQLPLKSPYLKLTFAGLGNMTRAHLLRSTTLSITVQRRLFNYLFSLPVRL